MDVNTVLDDEALEELESDVMSASAPMAQVHADRARAEERADYVLSQLSGVDAATAARFGRWLVNADQQLQDSLALLAEDPAGLEQAFKGVPELREGTLDAPWGAGPALLNRHTLAAFAHGLALYLLIACDEPTVVLAGERGASDLALCRVIAEVLASLGAVTYFMADACDVEAVADLVLQNHADAGVFLSAAGKDPGPVRVLGCDGEPLCEAACSKVNAVMTGVDMFDDVRFFDLRKALREGLVVPCGKEPDAR